MKQELTQKNELKFMHLNKPIVIRTNEQKGISIEFGYEGEKELLTKWFQPNSHIESIDLEQLKEYVIEYLETREKNPGSKDSFYTFFLSKKPKVVKETKVKKGTNLEEFDNWKTISIEERLFPFDNFVKSDYSSPKEYYYEFLLNLLQFVSENDSKFVTDEVQGTIAFIFAGAEEDSPREQKDWDWIDFDELYDSNKTMFFKIKNLAEKIILKHSYYQFDPESNSINYASLVTLDLLNQGGLFDNKDFHYNTDIFENNKVFLDTLVENWTMYRLLTHEKEINADTIEILSNSVLPEFSSYKNIKKDLFKDGIIKGYSGSLSREDYFDVIFSNFEKEIKSPRGDNFLDFRISMTYFFSLLKTEDSIIPFLENNKILSLFLNFKNNFWKLPDYGDSITKMYCKILVKNIIIDKLIKEEKISNFIKNLNISDHYYFKFSDSKILNRFEEIITFRDSSWKASVSQELKEKDKKMTQFINSLSFEEMKENNLSKADMVKVPLTYLLLSKNELELSEENIVNFIENLSEVEKKTTVIHLLKNAKSEEDFKKIVILFTKGSNNIKELIFFNIFLISSNQVQNTLINELFKNYDVNKLILLKTFFKFLQEKYAYGIVLLESSKSEHFKKFLKDFFEYCNSLQEWDLASKQSLIVEFYSELENFSQDKNINSEIIDSVLKNILKDKEFSNSLANSNALFKLLKQVKFDIENFKEYIELNENSVIEQKLFEFLKINNLIDGKTLNALYFENLLKISNYQWTAEWFDLNSIKNIVLNNSKNLPSLILEILKEWAWKGLDSYKLLNLVFSHKMLEELNSKELLSFYIEFIKILNDGDYDSEENTITHIFSKVFSNDKSAFDLVEKINKELFSKNDCETWVQEALNNFKVYVTRITNDKSVLGKVSNAFKSLFKSKEQQEEENRWFDMYSETMNILNSEENKLNTILRMVEDTNKKLVEVSWLLNEFKTLINNSILKNQINFTNNLMIFEGNLNAMLTRIIFNKNSITSTLQSFGNIKNTAKSSLTQMILQEELKKIISNLETINKKTN